MWRRYGGEHGMTCSKGTEMGMVVSATGIRDEPLSFAIIQRQTPHEATDTR